MLPLNSIKSLFVVLLLLPFVVFAKEVADLEIPDQVDVGGTSLVLNGAGVRSKFFIKVYVGALYSPHRSKSVSEIIEMPGPKRVAMHFLHDEVSREKIIGAWNDGFENNQTEKDLGKLKARIEQFNALFETAHHGDLITIDFVPEQGTSVAVNGEQKGVIEGADFYRALLLIWLGDDPADEDLKEAMVGGNEN